MDCPLNLHKKYIQFLRLINIIQIRKFFTIFQLNHYCSDLSNICCWCQTYYANILETIYFVIFGFPNLLNMSENAQKIYSYNNNFFNMKATIWRYKNSMKSQVDLDMKGCLSHKNTNSPIWVYYYILHILIETGKTCLTGVCVLI